MSNPTLTRAFNKGIEAFHKGVFNSPFSSGSLNHKEWQRGFDVAYVENQKGHLSNVQRIRAA
jgi:hypothetical protein